MYFNELAYDLTQALISYGAKWKSLVTVTTLKIAFCVNTTVINQTYSVHAHCMIDKTTVFSWIIYVHVRNILHSNYIFLNLYSGTH